MPLGFPIIADKPNLWRNPLAPPTSRMPRLNQNHPLANGILFAAVPFGSALRRIDGGGATSLNQSSNAVGSAVISGLGNAVENASAAGGSNNYSGYFSGFSGNTAGNTALMFIFGLNTNAGYNQYIYDSGARSFISISSANDFRLYTAGGYSIIAPGINNNTPYFILAGSNGNDQFLYALNLLTGQIASSLISGISQTNETISNITVGNYSPANYTPFMGYFGPVAVSSTPITLAQARQILQNPWSLWYADPFDFDYVGSKQSPILQRRQQTYLRR